MVMTVPGNLINGYISKIWVVPWVTIISNGRSPIRFGENRLILGGYPQKQRKLVGDDTITPGRGNHTARDHPDKYCSLGEKDTRYWVHALVCHISCKMGISLHLKVPLVI